MSNRSQLAYIVFNKLPACLPNFWVELGISEPTAIEDLTNVQWSPAGVLLRLLVAAQLLLHGFDI